MRNTDVGRGISLPGANHESPGLNNKVVIVTGAAAGIGRATARRFAGEGCRVTAWDRNDSDQAPDVEGTAAARNGGLFQRPMSPMPRMWRPQCLRSSNARGEIHVLINNAGILRDDQLVNWKDGR